MVNWFIAHFTVQVIIYWCPGMSFILVKRSNFLYSQEKLVATIVVYSNTKSPWPLHYNDVTMVSMASQITNLTIVYSAVYSGADQRKHQCSASLAFVWWIHRWPVNSQHKWPVTQKMFPFNDVFMERIDNHISGISPYITRATLSRRTLCLLGISENGSCQIDNLPPSIARSTSLPRVSSINMN